MTPRERRFAIRTKAEAQYGLISVSQLRQLGIEQTHTHRLVRDGSLVRLGRGVYLVGANTGAWHQRLMHAILAGGAGCVATGVSALRLWGIPEFAAAIDIDVTMPRRAAHRTVAKHRRVIDHQLAATIDGIPTTSIERAIFDLCCDPQHSIVATMSTAIRMNLTSEAKLLRELKHVARQGRVGVSLYRGAIRALRPRTVSELERRFVRIVEEAGFERPELQYKVFVEGRTYWLDAAWPRSQVCVELDSVAFHADADRFRTDRERQNRLIQSGWVVYRFTWAMLYEQPTEVVARIRAALLAGSPG